MIRVKKSAPLPQDLDALWACVNHVTVLPEEERTPFEEHAARQDLSRGAHLFRQGDAVDQVYFVAEGLLRVYYDQDGRETNRSFVLPNRLYTNSLAFNTRQPSHYAVQALEDCRLIRIPRHAVEASYDRSPVWDRFSRISSQLNINMRERRQTRFRSMTPEAHYVWMQENEAEILERVPLYHVASYLGITPETLSRIRARTLRRA